MSGSTRREFVRSGAALLVAGGVGLGTAPCFASPFNLPIGLQLYSVRELLPNDFEGTLKQIAALGYREVEAAGFFGRSASQVSKAMRDAGLRCVSAHYSWNDLRPNLSKVIAYHKELGARSIICSFPGVKDPSRLKNLSYAAQVQSFNIDDWRWNAEQFNLVGKQVKDAGLSFGYHNHTMEFAAQGGVIPFVELLRLTDPELVTIELDCGWVSVGGGDPVEYLERYPTRISMLHVKDFKPVDKGGASLAIPRAAELGRGTVDFHKLFHAARKSEIKHYFIEQEEYDKPPFDALRIDADYMKNFG